MNEMIERVIRAIDEAGEFTASVNAEGGPYESVNAGNMRRRLQNAARAAIQAMREPTEAMAEAGRLQFMCRSEDCYEIWNAMVGAALKDE